MPDIGLDGADVNAVLAENVADGIGLDGVASSSTSSVTLESVNN
jgi:hypothetical protein